MAAVPTIGRASGVERRPTAPEADATRALYERYSRQILNYCVHQLNSREEAEDAVQTTFMNAFRGLKRGIVPEAEQAWLFKIAENVCLSRRRSSWRRGKVESPNDFEVLQEIVPSKHANRADELIGLEDALEAMPENQRRAILLREWQGLSYREIADELELSQAAVETLIFRARRSLANGLESPVTPKKRRRISAAADGISLGSLIASLKTVLTGGAAIKAVAVAVAAGSATVAATQAEPALVHHFQHPVIPARTVHVTKQSRATFNSQATVVASRSGMSVAQAHAKTDRGVSLHDAVATSHAARTPHVPVNVTHVQTPPMVPAAPAPVAPVAPETPVAATPAPAVPQATPAEQPKAEPTKGNGDHGNNGAPKTEPTKTNNGNGNGNGEDKKSEGGAKAETPKADTPKADTPKTEAPKTETPKTEPTRSNGNGNNGNGDKGDKGNDKPKVEAPRAVTAPSAVAPQVTPPAATPATPVVTAPAPTNSGNGNSEKSKNSDRKADTTAQAAAAPVVTPPAAPVAPAADNEDKDKTGDKGKGKGKGK